MNQLIQSCRLVISKRWLVIAYPRARFYHARQQQP
jgi:hypothetical protein